MSPDPSRLTPAQAELLEAQARRVLARQWSFRPARDVDEGIRALEEKTGLERTEILNALLRASLLALGEES